MKKFENRVVIVTRETRLEKVLVSQNTVSQAKFYINSLGGDFDEYQAEHDQYAASVTELRRRLEELVNVQLVDRKYLPNFMFAPGDIVAAIGQDGLVANTLKYLDGQPLIGINPDPARWDGVLLPFKPADAAKIVTETIGGKRKFEEVVMAKARVQNGQELLAVNDFFIGQKTHSSARYVIKYGGLKEPQSSSGVIVSTGLGSTGWMKSIISGASRINASVIGRPYGGAQESENVIEEDEEDYSAKSMMEERVYAPGEIPMDEPLADMDMMTGESADFDPRMIEEAAPAMEYARMVKPSKKFIANKKKSFGPSELAGVVGKWSSTELMFAVREPFPSRSTGTNIVFGTISPGKPLRIESLMGENGVIFSDGIESDFIAFNSGAEAVIGLAEKRGRMVV